MDVEFKPSIETLGKYSYRPTKKEISNETILFQSDLEYSSRHGGDLTRSIIDQLFKNQLFLTHYKNNQNVIVDTRSTLTMPGTYPSIPGWHCDDVPRSIRSPQPDLSMVSENVQHFMVLLSDVDNVSSTEFVTEKVMIDVDPDRVWNSVDQHLNQTKVKTGFLETGLIIRFDQKTIHRASPSLSKGWRLFFRLSLSHKPPRNEIRKQVQVYTTINGW